MKKSKIIIALSMLCIIISTISICFSIAWYAMYPTFTDLKLSVGNAELLISNEICVRKAKKTPASETAPNIYEPIWGGEMGKDYNIKIFDTATREHVINPGAATPGGTVGQDVATGAIKIEFNPMAINLFNNIDSSNNVDGGLLDETTMSIDTRYLNLIIFELDFYNGTFDNYVAAKLSVDVQYNNQPFTTPLFVIRSVEDNETDDNLRKSISLLGLNEATQTQVQKDRVNTLENTYVKASDPLHALPLDANNPLNLFDNYAGATTEISAHQRKINFNPNRVEGVRESNFYSYACAYVIGMDAVEYVKYFKANNMNQGSFSIALTINFYSSGEALRTAEIDKGVQ